MSAMRPSTSMALWNEVARKKIHARHTTWNVISHPIQYRALFVAFGAGRAPRDIEEAPEPSGEAAAGRQPLGTHPRNRWRSCVDRDGFDEAPGAPGAASV